jgi:metallo-beta-lactamase family protein
MLRRRRRAPILSQRSHMNPGGGHRMSIRISFLGAAQNVTGSRYLVEALDKKILVDCGIFQERPLRDRNWKPFPVPPAEIDCIVLTHAHLDHCGYVPRLVRDGFSGPVYCTPTTADVARIVMLDSGHINEEDAAKKMRRHSKEARRGPNPIEPLYTMANAEEASKLLRHVKYNTPHELAPGITISLHDAGHILGSSILKMKIDDGASPRTILFSGDLGRWDRPILNDPTLFTSADYVVMESTYGERVHGEMANIEDLIQKEIEIATEAGGNIVIPTFAVERAHELLYYLNELLRSKRIPPLPVFLDSPMAIEVTKVFQRHAEIYDEEMKKYVSEGRSPFDFPGLRMTVTVDQSKSINLVKGTAVIMSGSGMCTGGRVKHHLVQNIARPECTILFVGYQSAGTLGRQILDKPEEVRIFGKTFPVRARIAQVHGFSGHADRNELLRWVSNLAALPKRIFVTHGEKESAESFAAYLREQLGAETTVPGYRDTAVLD